MKMNSDSALAAGRKVLASNGNNWGKVHDAGTRRADDGVIVVHARSAAPKGAVAPANGKR